MELWNAVIKSQILWQIIVSAVDDSTDNCTLNGLSGKYITTTTTTTTRRSVVVKKKSEIRTVRVRDKSEQKIEKLLIVCVICTLPGPSATYNNWQWTWNRLSFDGVCLFTKIQLKIILHSSSSSSSSTSTSTFTRSVSSFHFKPQ